MPREKDTQRPNFYETSSPFETYSGPSAKSRATSFGGLVDTVPMPRKSDINKGVADAGPMSRFHPEQFDNPRGFPGIALVTKGDERSKLPYGKHLHSIVHHMEGLAAFERTGKGKK